MRTSETEFIRIAGLPDRKDEDGAPRPSEGGLPEALPVLGLSDIVIFPGMVVPLLVESVPSIRLIDDVVAGDRLITLVLQRNPDTTEPRPEELYQVGCAGRLLRMLKLPDNTVRILAEGLRRVRIGKYLSRKPYLRARCEAISEAREETMETAALTRNIRAKFEEISELSPALTEQARVAALNEEDPSKLADLIAGNVNLSLSERQELLETDRLKARLNRLLSLLAREAELLALGSKIQSEVTSSVNRNQREFFLREQMRAIQRELGEGEGGGSETETLREQIQSDRIPEEVGKVALKELDRLQAMPPSAAEYTVVRNYLDCLLNLPWKTSTKDKLDLARAEKILDAQHHGLAKVKDRLLEFLAVMKLRRDVKGPILCLVGPPGVGKTSLGKSVADAIGRKFVRFALGGMRDEAEIRGHRRTYVGAMPGRIIQSLRRAESNNPVMLLDEVDKVGADVRGDPASALLEVLDPHQNHAFVDHYLDLPFDLSPVLFIATANWLDPVHPALRDRMEVIELPSYTSEEKLQIAKRHLVPRQLTEHGLADGQLRFSDASLRALIRGYTREAGVRHLEREIAALARKSARRLLRRGKVKRLAIKGSDLPEMLGPQRFESDTAERITECGIATGLAWTPVGGELLFIEATRMTGSGKLLLTGSLGDVMKESAQAALSFLRTQAPSLDLTPTAFEKHDLHIHVPAGAIPKDGPSAGVTIVTALASLLTSRRVRSNVAMTGEISLRGRVLPVGGIKEKVLAAARAGIKQVILPEQNRKDWVEVPADLQNKLTSHFVKDIGTALRLALTTRGVKPSSLSLNASAPQRSAKKRRRKSGKTSATRKNRK